MTAAAGAQRSVFFGFGLLAQVHGGMARTFFKMNDL
jgi:hypothetical protein